MCKNVLATDWGSGTFLLLSQLILIAAVPILASFTELGQEQLRKAREKTYLLVETRRGKLPPLLPLPTMPSNPPPFPFPNSKSGIRILQPRSQLERMENKYFNSLCC